MRPQSEYLFVEVAAQRCLQLMRGAKPKIDGSGARKYTTLAIKEVEQGLIPWRIVEPGEELELVPAEMREQVELGHDAPTAE